MRPNHEPCRAPSLSPDTCSPPPLPTVVPSPQDLLPDGDQDTHRSPVVRLVPDRRLSSQVPQPDPEQYRLDLLRRLPKTDPLDNDAIERLPEVEPGMLPPDDELVSIESAAGGESRVEDASRPASPAVADGSFDEPGSDDRPPATTVLRRLPAVAPDAGAPSTSPSFPRTRWRATQPFPPSPADRSAGPVLDDPASSWEDPPPLPLQGPELTSGAHGEPAAEAVPMGPGNVAVSPTFPDESLAVAGPPEPADPPAGQSGGASAGGPHRPEAGPQSGLLPAAPKGLDAACPPPAYGLTLPLEPVFPLLPATRPIDPSVARLGAGGRVPQPVVIKDGSAGSPDWAPRRCRSAHSTVSPSTTRRRWTRRRGPRWTAASRRSRCEPRTWRRTAPLRRSRG